MLRAASPGQSRAELQLNDRPNRSRTGKCVTHVPAQARTVASQQHLAPLPRLAATECRGDVPQRCRATSMLVAVAASMWKAQQRVLGCRCNVLQALPAMRESSWRSRKPTSGVAHRWQQRQRDDEQRLEQRQMTMAKSKASNSLPSLSHTLSHTHTLSLSHIVWLLLLHAWR
jgi:hypothetical protein